MNQSSNIAENVISAGKGIMDNEWVWALIMMCMAGVLIFVFMEELAKIGKWVVAGILILFFLYGSGVIVNKKTQIVVKNVAEDINKFVKPAKKDLFIKRWWRKTVLRNDDPDLIAYGNNRK